MNPPFHREGGLTLERAPGLTPWVRELLGRVEWGTTGPRYQLADPEAELSTLSADTHVLIARAKGEPVGCYLLAPRVWTLEGRRLEGFYRGLLAVVPEYLGRGYGRYMVEAVKAHYLSGPGVADFLYGYIEEDNEASLRLSEAAGYESAGTFGAYAFARTGRLAPDPEVRAADPSLGALLAKERSSLLREDLPQSFAERPHWVITGSDGVRAGLSVKPKRWRFTHLPGPSGWFARRLGPHLPVLGRLFQPDDFRFLALGHLYRAEGEEEAFERLLCHVLAKHERPAALAFLDHRVAEGWKGRLGWLHRLGMGSRLHFMWGARPEWRPRLAVHLAEEPLPISLRDDA